jgi:hypothetical protein
MFLVLRNNYIPSRFSEIQLNFPDFLEYLHLPNDYYRAEGCPIYLGTCCSLHTLLYQFLKMITTFLIRCIFYGGMKRVQSDEQNHSLEISAVSRHIMKMTCRFSSLPISAEDGPISVPSYT